MAIDLSFESRPSTRALGPRFDSWTMDGVIAVGVAVSVATVIALVITQVVDFTVYNLRVGALNSDFHASIFGIMSLVAEGVMSAAAAFRALHSERRAPWLVLAALAAALVVVRAALPGSAPAFAVPCAVLFVVVWRLTSADPTRARAVIRVSLYLLAFSFVVHVFELKVAPELGFRPDTWAGEIKCMVKHAAELSGWFLLAAGVLAGMLPRRAGTFR
jgi:hypothetical protein